MPFRTTVKALVILLSGCSSGGDGGGNVGRTDQLNAVLYGPISEIQESRVDWIWGDSINWLCQQWSERTGSSGFFYGTSRPWSNADVFVLESSVDPLSVVAAENFAYTTDSVFAFEGDTVFFRGTNGFFGAWTIDQIDDQTHETLSGTWYFKAGGGGDFTAKLIEGLEPMRQGFCSTL